MEAIQELQEQLKQSELKQNARKITASRGRLIKKLKEEIARIKSGNATEEEKQELQHLEDLLTENLASHKTQLSSRYKEEFLQRAGSIPSIITALPKGIALAVKKVANSISSLKEAKDNKERIFGIFDVLKQSGLLLATPIIFTGKFMMKQWFATLILLTYLYNVPGYLFDKLKTVTEKNLKADGSSLLDSITPDWIYTNDLTKTSLGQEIRKDLTDPEVRKRMNMEAWNRFKNLPADIKNAYLYVRENIDSIKAFFKGNKAEMPQEVQDALASAEQKLGQTNFSDPECSTKLADIGIDLETLRASITNKNDGLVPGLSI